MRLFKAVGEICLIFQVQVGINTREIGEKRMKRMLAIFTIALLLPLGFVSSPLAASEMDILLKKLVEKNVLSPEEAKAIQKETTMEMQKQKEEVKKEVTEDVKKSVSDWIPKWVQKTKVKGDLRLRYQYQDTSGKVPRNRGRFRYRISFTNQVTDFAKVGLRLASGGSDPRSTNQTLTDTFSSKGINIDRAYAELKFFDALKIKGGKFSNPIFTPWDLLWDSDINPEGASFIINYDMFFANASFWILDEYSGSSLDPYMVPLQVGVAPKIDNFYIKAAATGYLFGNVKGNALDYSAGTNSTDDDGNLIYDYNSISGSLEAGVYDVAPDFGIERIALFGTMIYNFDPDEVGYIAGFKFGAKKLPQKFGQWEFIYNYRYLERDAWLDTFPDSDAFDGETNVKGHEFIFRLGLAKHLELGFDVYYMEQIDGDDDQLLGQADLIFKF